MRWIEDLIADKSDDAPALIDHDGARLTYADLRRAVAEGTRALRDLGVRPGDRVLVVAENSVLMAVAFLAAAGLRAWCIPLNARLTGPELDAIRAHATPRAVVFTTDVSVDAQGHAHRLGAGPGPVVLGRPWIALTDPAAQPESVAATPEDQVAAMVYTSGTTGEPKGVMLSHASLLFNATHSARSRGMGPGDEIALSLPCTHIMALSTALLAAFQSGACVRLLPRFSVAGQLAALAQGATIMSGVPLMYEHILRACEGGTGLDAPRLRMIGCGGAPLDPALKARVEALFGLPLANGYGLTEAGPGISSTSFGPYRADGSVGYPYPGCDARVANPGPDGVGELEFRGPNVMLGYYLNPRATTQAMTEDGYLRTGDLARIDPDGALHLVGRLKEVIIRSGFNVYPPEVEAALMSCPGVVQAAVLGRRVPGNEEVLAYVTTDGDVAPATIAAHLRARLAAYKQPQQVIVVPAMPLTSAGKIRKPDLLREFGPN